MPLKNIPLTKQDFEAVQFEAVFKDCQKKECDRYSSKFFACAREAEASGDEKSTEIFTLLGGITSMMLEPNSSSEPFSPMVVMGGSRSAIIDDFSNEHVSVLREIVSDIKDAELRARIADVVWIRSHDFDMVLLAITSYLESASVLEDPRHWSASAERIERAFRLAVSLGNNTAPLEQVISHIETVLDRYAGEDPLFFSARLMELLLEAHRGDGAKYAALSQKAATRAEKEPNWRRARTYWGINAKWHEQAKDTKRQRAARIAAAETYVREAQAASSTSHLAAAHHQQKAVEAYRRLGDEKDRVQELHKTLLQYQQRSLDEMKPVSAQVDISEVAKNAVAQVESKSLQEAILALARLIRPADVNKLRKEVEESVKKYPLQHLLSQDIVNDQGKVVGRMPDLHSTDAQEREQALRANMFQNLRNFHHLINTQGVIEPARRQINIEHHVRIHDFVSIMSDNPLVPPGREYIYAKGFQEGMSGDFLTATHLLIPQFENSVRYLLSQRGVITSGINPQGIQEEYDLGKTLYMSETHEIFGENITFELQGLLVERFGANLRNRMAHGLMTFDAFYSVEISYLWWLLLHLCCLPILVAQARDAAAKPESESGETQQ